MKRNTCIFCHQPTDYTYRDTRQDNLDNNLISCCPSCRIDKPYLMISRIGTQPKLKIIQPWQPASTSPENTTYQIYEEL